MEIEDEEERELRMRRMRISRKPLTSIVVEDDEEIAKKIKELREKERKEEEEKEKELYNRKNVVVVKGERYKKLLEEKEKVLLAMEQQQSQKAPKLPPPPPLYNNDVGHVDASNACLIVVDMNDVKQVVLSNGGGNFKYHFSWLITFAVGCRYKRCLEMFDHPGIPHNLVRVESDGYLHDVAAFAIDYYNKICKDARLELTNIVRINRYGGCCCHKNYYVTLHAKDKNTGQIGLYQAAVAEHYNIDAAADDDNSDKYLLGLLRDCCGDRALAIISLTGVDEDLEKRSKQLLLM